VRRGSDVKVKVLAQRVRGAEFTKTVTVHVPRSLARGEHVLQLTGTPADAVAGEGDQQDLASTFTITLGDEDAGDEDDPGPRNLSQLAAAFAGLAREDGVTASFHDPGDAGGDSSTAEIEVYRDPQLRISGSAKLRVVVKR
jgi:hypothetical protein